MIVIRTHRPSHGKRLMFLLLAIACGMVITALSSLPGVTASAQAPVEDKIAFGHPDGQIYTMNADGTGLTPLGFGFDPTWSPDGQKIAFGFANTVETTLVYVMDADGSNRTQLTEAYQDHSPAFSPDGTTIAFVSERVDPDFPVGDDMHSTDRVYLMNADGTNERKLLQSGLRTERAPAFSPDGQKVAFVGQSVSPTGTSVFNIYVVNVDGTGLTQLTHATGVQIDSNDVPAFSPDGEKVAFSMSRDIYAVNADGSGAPVNLTNNGSNADSSDPTYSPEGDKIVYRANVFSGTALDGLYVMQSDGQNRAFLNVQGADPAWKPRPVNPTPTPTPTPEPTPEPTPTPTPVPVEADISVLLTAAPASPKLGKDFTYTLQVENHGPDTATNVSAFVGRASSMTFVSVTSTQGSCAPSNNSPLDTVCQFGDLANGAKAKAYVTVRPNAVGEFTALSSASSAVDDPYPPNNVQGLKLTVDDGCADDVTSQTFIQIQRPSVNSRGKINEQTIRVRNDSGRRLNGLVHFLFDNMPASVSIASDPRTFRSRCYAPGMPYTSVGVGANELVWEPGQTIALKVRFANPDQERLDYQLRVLVGPDWP